jgi:hypothetical protein
MSLQNPTPLNVPGPQTLSTLTPKPGVPAENLPSTPPPTTPVLTEGSGPPAVIDVPGSATPYTDAINASGPKVWWRFNDASPSAVVLDTEGNSNAAQLDTAAVDYRQPGLIAEAGQFSSGVGDPANYGFEGSITNNLVPIDPGFSIEFWMKTNPLVSDQNILVITTESAFDSLTLKCTDNVGSGSLQSSASGISEVLPSGTFATTSVYYVLNFFTRRGGGRVGTLYRNGVEVVTFAAPIVGTYISLIDFGPGAVAFGTAGGNIDEFALYDKTLSLDEIAAHYAAGLVATIPASTTIEPVEAFTQVTPPTATEVLVPGGQATVPVTEQ